jgi:hypothetical protein
LPQKKLDIDFKETFSYLAANPIVGYSKAGRPDEFVKKSPKM